MVRYIIIIFILAYSHFLIKARVLEIYFVLTDGVIEDVSEVNNISLEMKENMLFSSKVVRSNVVTFDIKMIGRWGGDSLINYFDFDPILSDSDYLNSNNKTLYEALKRKCRYPLPQKYEIRKNAFYANHQEVPISQADTKDYKSSCNSFFEECESFFLHINNNKIKNQ